MRRIKVKEQFVLLQCDNGIKKPVAYARKNLTLSQTKYSPVEKDCFAIVWAVQKFQILVRQRILI